MLKINNIEITKEDFEDLLGSIQLMQRNLKDGNLASVEFMLETLESHLKNNLMQDDRLQRETA